MAKTFKKAIAIECSSNEEKMAISRKIHCQLVGNKDYIDSNIVLNHDEDCMVMVFIFNECEEMPEIII